MIDKQSLLNNPNIQWQSVEGKKTQYSLNKTEEDQLRHEATNRISELVTSTKFIGYGGAKVNADGSYDIITKTGSELADDKLKEMLGKAFEEDDELNGILDKLRALNAKNIHQTESKNDQDSFVRSDPQTASAEKQREQNKYENAFRENMFSVMFPTLTPATSEGGIKSVENWIQNGGEFPNLPIFDHTTDYGVLAHQKQADKNKT